MRPQKCRFLRSEPTARFYKPQGIPLRDLQIVQLKDEELEAVNLTDHKGLDGTEAAKLMEISRPTFSRILNRARQRMAEALVEGKALQINGGNYRRAPHKKKEKKMKILITSSGKELGNPMDARFGRAPYFLVYDTESQCVAVLDNTDNSNGTQGVGIRAAETAARAGASIVLSGRVGPKAFRSLQDAGIKIFYAKDMTGTQALEQFLAGTLPETDNI